MLGREGYLRVSVPEEFGDAGMGEMAIGLVTQTFAKYNPAIALS